MYLCTNQEEPIWSFPYKGHCPHYSPSTFLPWQKTTTRGWLCPTAVAHFLLLIPSSVAIGDPWQQCLIFFGLRNTRLLVSRTSEPAALILPSREAREGLPFCLCQTRYYHSPLWRTMTLLLRSVYDTTSSFFTEVVSSPFTVPGGEHLLPLDVNLDRVTSRWCGGQKCNVTQGDSCWIFKVKWWERSYNGGRSIAVACYHTLLLLIKRYST